MIVTAFLGFGLLRSPTWFKHNNNNNNINNNNNNKINNNNNNNYAKGNKKIKLRSNILEVAINTINKGLVSFNRVLQFIVNSNYICLSLPLSLQATHQASIWNINEWLSYAQDSDKRALERVLRDLQKEIGGSAESKSKFINGLDHLMYKYSQTSNPHGINVNNELTNIEINRQNMVAAANFKNKIIKEVPDTHVTPPASDYGYDTHCSIDQWEIRSLRYMFIEMHPWVSAFCLLFIAISIIIAYFTIRALYNKYKLKIKNNNKFKSKVNIIKSVYTTKKNEIAPVLWRQNPKSSVFNYKAMSKSKYIFLHKNTFIGSTSYRRVLPIYFLYRKKKL